MSEKLRAVGIRLITASATLQVDDDHRKFAEQEAELRRQARYHADDAKLKMARLTAIHNMFLHDSAIAALWWSEGKPERLLDLATHKDKFVAAVKLLDGTAADRAETEQTSDLINVFLRDLGPDHRDYLLDQLARVFTSYDRPDLADKLKPTSDAHGGHSGSSYSSGAVGSMPGTSPD